MRTFLVYLKHRQSFLSLNCGILEVEYPYELLGGARVEGKFLFYDDNGEVANIFIPFSEVDMILPADQEVSAPGFEVYFKDRTDPITVKAHHFTRYVRGTISFNEASGKPISDIYLDMAEVIAILPENVSEGESEE